MQFEDLHEAEDERTRRRRVVVIIGIVMLFSSFVYIFFFSGIDFERYDANPQTDRAMAHVRRLERMIDLCRSVPKPESVNWESATIIEHNDGLTIFSEVYKSERISDEILPFFQIWLNSNGWSRRERKPGERGATSSATVNTFSKGNQEISVISSAWTKFYSVECLEQEAAVLAE